MTAVKSLGVSNGARSVTLEGLSYQPGDDAWTSDQGEWQQVTIVSGPVVRALHDLRDLAARAGAGGEVTWALRPHETPVIWWAVRLEDGSVIELPEQDLRR